MCKHLPKHLHKHLKWAYIMSLKISSNLEHSKTYTFMEEKILLFHNLTVAFLITLPIIIRIWNAFHGNVDFEGKPMKITFSLMTQKVFHADTSYLGQIMSTILASLRKYNCDLRPSSRPPDRRSNP